MGCVKLKLASRFGEREDGERSRPFMNATLCITVSNDVSVKKRFIVLKLVYNVAFRLS